MGLSCVIPYNACIQKYLYTHNYTQYTILLRYFKNMPGNIKNIGKKKTETELYPTLLK